MTSALHDFQQFHHWLHNPEHNAPEDVLRFANIVLANFDVIAASSMQRSQRSTVLAGLARPLLLTTNAAPPPAIPAAQVGDWSWRSLRSLVVGPFRGFRNPEVFDLQRRIVMFSGPNGSGKTSLCEALELAMLGSVEEGALKRMTAESYFANIHEGRYASPTLTASDQGGQPVPVPSDSDAYRFCFVEKNRIDNFSRIAAKPAGEKTELIATLFGMDRFNDFVGHFNESMDGQLTLQGLKQRELTNKRTALAQDVATINGEQVALQGFARVEANYAAAYAPGLAYSGLLTMIGSPQVPGRLQEINAVLNTPAPSIWGVSSSALLAVYRAADAAEAAVVAAAAALVNKAGEVSFKSLYTAVLGVQGASPNHCPACGTPLRGDNHALHDPYAKSTSALNQLRELGELQAQQAKAVGDREVASRSLAVALTTFAQRVGATSASEAPVQRYVANPQVDYRKAWWKDGYIPDASGVSLAKQAIDWAAELEKSDATARQVVTGRQQLIQERDRLLKASVDAATFAAHRQTAGAGLVAARARIFAFDTANAQLIQAAEREVQEIACDIRIKAAYDQFLIRLRQYRTQLPGTLMAGLNTLAMELYNSFNQRDLDADKLQSLHLPVTADGRIELSFRRTPDRRVDALHVLSEGHVRCLGLAILLAKGLSIRAPVIVFDDAINAIDTEHREGIRETIFQGDRFSETQIIVTCHSNEFIKDIQNHVPTNQWIAYYFMPHIGNFHPRVAGNQSSQNYLANARAALNQGNSRDALGSARQALEMLTGKIWKWLGKCDQGMLTLKLAGAGAEPPLRNLCESIRARLREATTFAHPDKTPVADALGVILGIPEASLVWLYLNKGTHEEANRDDFDTVVVESVIQTLEAVARLQLRPNVAA
jgi:recombinational DNA repair ATPase RecF